MKRRGFAARLDAAAWDMHCADILLNQARTLAAIGHGAVPSDEGERINGLFEELASLIHKREVQLEAKIEALKAGRLYRKRN